MTPDELAAIVERDRELTPERDCHCDAASFWDGVHCAICGHGPDVHGDVQERCAVRVPRRLSEPDADRRVLLGLLRETRARLRTIELLADGQPGPLLSNYRAEVLSQARDALVALAEP